MRGRQERIWERRSKTQKEKAVGKHQKNRKRWRETIERQTKNSGKDKEILRKTRKLRKNSGETVKHFERQSNRETREKQKKMERNNRNQSGNKTKREKDKQKLSGKTKKY